MKEPAKRFSVAQSFAGEQRPFVKDVAECLAKKLGQKRVFYDDWYKAELARPDLDIHLQNIYNRDSELIVVYLSKDYANKEWCDPIEWRAIRELLKKKLGHKIMFVRFDDADIRGVFSQDGYISAKSHTPEQVASLILERLALVQAENETPNDTGGAAKDQHATRVISDSGNLILLGTHLFRESRIKTQADGSILAHISSGSAEEEAAIKTLGGGRAFSSEPIPFAYQNDSLVVRVKRLQSESVGTKKSWILELEPANVDYGGSFMSDIATLGYSADDIAKMRAGRILLNDPPGVSPNLRLRDAGGMDKVALETLISGLNTAARIRECPMPIIYGRLKEDPILFMQVARLQAIFLLRASGAIEHVIELVLGPIVAGKMHVRFRGKRRKIYTNKDATIIELEGDCPLE